MPTAGCWLPMLVLRSSLTDAFGKCIVVLMLIVLDTVESRLRCYIGWARLICYIACNAPCASVKLEIVTSPYRGRRRMANAEQLDHKQSIRRNLRTGVLCTY